MIILTSRENPAEEWLVANSDQIQLPNLNAREVEAKTAHLLRQPLEPSLKREIYAKSGGNPLFLEEICHSLANTDNRPGWQTIVTALPANVQALIAARMERLDSGDLQIVRTAAAHGEQISIDLLSEVSGMRVDAATLSRLTALDVMSAVAASDGDGDGGGVRFKHGVARDVVYSMIPPDAQVDLHRSYAARLRDRAGGDPAAEVAISEILAMHYRGAGDVANALDFAEISGDKALAASSLDKAMWHYGAALDLIDETSPDETSLRRWVSIARRWAVPCVYAASSRHLPALERAETLANRLQDWRAAAWARYWVGYLHFVLGQHEKALRNLSAAGDIAAEEGDAGLEAEAMAIRGCVYSATGKRERGEEQMRAAIVEKDRNPGKRGRPPVTSVYTRANLAVLVADQGRFEEADDLIAEALRRVRGYGHEVESSILNFAAACHLMRRNWDVALDYASRSRERSEKVSSPYLMGMSRCIWGYARHRLGGEEASEGLEMLSTAAWSMEKRGMRLYLSFVFGWLSDALSEAGRFEDVEAAYTAAMARARTGEIVGAAMACRASAIVAMEAGRPEEAASRLEMAANFTKRRASPQDSGANLLARARLDRLTGRVSEARDALARADEIFDRPELVRWQTVAHRIRVELGL
ncbi:MAG: tetratricopeptide repeat protein [Pseudomonadota bacterium]